MSFFQITRVIKAIIIISHGQKQKKEAVFQNLGDFVQVVFVPANTKATVFQDEVNREEH